MCAGPSKVLLAWHSVCFLNKIFTGLFVLFFWLVNFLILLGCLPCFFAVWVLILLCQCSLPVPTLLLLPPSPPPHAVPLSILPSHSSQCCVPWGGGGALGGSGTWGARGRGIWGEKCRITEMYFCSFVFLFSFPYFSESNCFLASTIYSLNCTR